MSLWFDNSLRFLLHDILQINAQCVPNTKSQGMKNTCTTSRGCETRNPLSHDGEQDRGERGRRGGLRGEERVVGAVQAGLPDLVVAPRVPHQLEGGLHALPALLVVVLPDDDLDGLDQLLAEDAVGEGQRGERVGVEEGVADDLEQLGALAVQLVLAPGGRGAALLGLDPQHVGDDGEVEHGLYVVLAGGLEVGAEGARPVAAVDVGGHADLLQEGVQVAGRPGRGGLERELRLSLSQDLQSDKKDSFNPI